VIFFNVICVMRVIEFFIVVRTTVIKDIKAYIEMKKQNASAEQL